MPPTIPGMGIIFPKIQMFDNNGHPAAGYKLDFWISGTSTPLDTFTESSLAIGTENTNPVILDANGRATIYLQPKAYKVRYRTNLDVEIWTSDPVLDVGSVLFNLFGQVLATGGKGITTTPYAVLTTDNFITIQSAAGPKVVNLPAATRTFPLAIKNMANNTVTVTPAGADTIDGNAAPFVIPSTAGGVMFPTIWLFPDGVSNWWILAAVPLNW